MPRKKPTQNNLSKFIDKKIQIEDLPKKTIKVTFHALRWIFLLVFLFMAIGIFALFVTGGQENVQMIIGYSIAGFFTFFMGYFGWILAQGTIEMITGSDDVQDGSFTSYSKKGKKYKY